MSEELPFELPKRHKNNTIHKWKSRGLIETYEKIVEIYNRYIWASHCELCGNPFKSSRDRQMDHDHTTGKFRNIVCNKCNQCRRDLKCSSNTGELYITKTIRKDYTDGVCYEINIRRNGKRVLGTRRATLQEAIEVRDKFIAENPQYFL